MNFYRRRPLALVLSLCMLVSAAAYFMPGLLKLILIAVIGIGIPLTVFLFRRWGIRNICDFSAKSFVYLCGALIMAFLLTAYGFYDVYADNYSGIDKAEARILVTDVKSQTAYSAVYEVKLKSAGEKYFPAKGILYSEHAVSLSAGDVVRAEVEFVPLDEFYEAYEVSRLEMMADGYVISLRTVGAVASEPDEMSFDVLFSKLRDMLGAKMSLYLNYESSALADALLLGERDELGRIQRDFREIGVVHVLALSGMHIAILAGGLERLLKGLRIGIKPRYILMILFLMFYTALTGFLVSVVRAALMMTMVYAAAYFERDGDRVTSLFTACGLIILTSPAAVFDMSLQLSFSATLGVTLLSEASDKRKTELSGSTAGRILRRLFGAFAVSLGAGMFILPLQWLYFGEISPIGVPSTLLISAVCELLLLLLPLYLLSSIAGLHFVCGRLGFIIGVITELCTEIARFLADAVPPVSLGYPFVPLLIADLVGVIVYMMKKNVRSWLYSLIPFAVFFALLIGGAGVYERTHASDTVLHYASYGTNDGVLLISRRKAMLVDITGGSSLPLAMLDGELQDECLTSVDTLLITKLTRRHIISIRKFIKYTRVDRILVPAPADEYENGLVNDLYESAEAYGAEIDLYPRNEQVNMLFGDITVSLPEITYINRSTYPLEAVRFEMGDSSVSYIGCAAWEDDEVWKFAKDADAIIFGRNGPRFKTPPDGKLSPETVKIHIPDADYAEELGDLISEYKGKVTVGDRYRIHLTPDSK